MKHLKIIFLCLSVFLSMFISVSAQESLTLTVTPPLFKINLGPGESWKSSVKVVNSNPVSREVFVSVLNFESAGEGGRGKLVPVPEGEKKETLAAWVRVPEGPVYLPPEGSAEIPFSLEIPENASPGGHYAAIVVGTEPGEEGGGSVVKISSMISSLLLVEVRGDVRESGIIREFSTKERMYQKPAAEFALRFENQGNVHVQPQGDIVIFNMWGRERGRIPINQESQFGNVLPGQTRRFAFEWKGEESVFDAGRYVARATLAYGRAERQSVTREISFWIIPLKPIFSGIAGIGGVVLVLIAFARWYIRKILEEEAKKRGVELPEEKRRAGRGRLVRFLQKHGKIALITAVVIFIGIGVQKYVSEVLEKERSFEIVIPTENG